MQREDNPDYGLDWRVEIFDAEEEATALSFSAQLKGTDEPDVDRALGSVRFRRDTAEYYREQTQPVLIVRYHAPSERLFARWFHAYNPHIARRRLKADAKSVRFQLYPEDEVESDFAEWLEAGVRGFQKFRSPELRLPLRVAVTATEASPDVRRATFALRRVLDPVGDLVTVEVRDPAPDDPSITLEPRRVVVSLADVASVTLDRNAPGDEASDDYAADVTLALCVALTFVGQANLAAQVAAAVGPLSTVIADPEVAVTLAGAMFRSQRIREAIELADQLDGSEDDDLRMAGFVLLTVLLAKHDRLRPAERDAALAGAKRRLKRREEAGDDAGTAAEAYNLGKLHMNLRQPRPAAEQFRAAAHHDATYLDRGYYHADLGGVLFEEGDFGAAERHYARAVELGESGLVHALLADALLWSGRYAAARDRLDTYLSQDPGSDGAEWRLKARTLDLVIDTVGPDQARDLKGAERILDAWTFETDISNEDAQASCWSAIERDACFGTAWYRLGLLAFFASGVPRDGAPAGVAGAVLGGSEEAWQNAVIFTDPRDTATVFDLFYGGYRRHGSGFVDAVAGAIAEAEGLAEHRDDLTALLDEAILAVDRRREEADAVLRFKGEDGEMREISFGPEERSDLAEPAKPARVRWRPPSAEMPGTPRPRGARKKRPPKTHGKNKRRKRKK